MAFTIRFASNAAASAWTDISDRVRRESVRMGGVAANGQVGSGFGFDFVDEAAAVTIPTKRVVQLLVDGTVRAQGRVMAKGTARPKPTFMRAGDAREFDVQVSDGNAHLYGIAVHGWVRPEETDVARVQALLAAFLSGSPRASTDLADTWVNTSGAITIPAKTYNLTNPNDVLAEVARMAGKLYFVTVDDELFYSEETSTAYSVSSFSVTDVLGSVDGTSVFWPISPSGDQNGADLLSGVKLAYGTDTDGETPLTVHVVDSAVASAHDWWEASFSSAGAVTSGQATTEANGLLLEVKRDEEDYRLAVDLAESQLGKVKYGQMFSLRSAALAITSPRTVRIGRVEYEPLANGDWRLHLEAGFPDRIAARRERGAKGGPVSGGPRDPDVIGPIQDATCEKCGVKPPFTCDPTVFDVQLEVGTGGQADCFVQEGDNGCDTDDDPIVPEKFRLYKGAWYLAAVEVFHASADGPVIDAGVKHGGTNLISWGFGSTFAGTETFEHHGEFQMPDDGLPPAYVDDVVGWIDSVPFAFHPATGYQVRVAVAYTGYLHETGEPDPRFDGLEPCGTPSVNQHTVETGTVAGGTGGVTTNYPYQPGSVNATVGGVAVTPTETDPTTGSVTFVDADGNPLPDGTVIVIHYQIADPTYVGGTTPNSPPTGTNTIPPYNLLGSGGDGSGDNVLHDDGTWSPDSGGVTDHGALTGLADNDHPQYVRTTNGGAEQFQSHGAAGSTETIDLANGNYHALTLDADCTLTLTGSVASRVSSMTLEVTQDGTGGWELTWPGSVVWSGGTVVQPDADADAVSFFVLHTRDNGTTWYAFPVGGSGTASGRWELAVIPGSPPDPLYADGDYLYILVP